MEACLARFGALRPDSTTPVVRSDNLGGAQRQWPNLQSRRFRVACHDYRLRQEVITPYTPEQNGIVERFFRSLKGKCIWQHDFGNFAAARTAKVFDLVAAPSAIERARRLSDIVSGRVSRLAAVSGGARCESRGGAKSTRA